MNELEDIFDVRFWGAAKAAQVAKIRQGGSITLTIGKYISVGVADGFFSLLAAQALPYLDPFRLWH